MTKEETLKPHLAPKTYNTKSAKSRERMTSEEHGKVLHERSKSKQMKLRKIKAQNDDREVEECTFTPLTNTFKKNPGMIVQEREMKQFKVPL